MIKDIIIYSIWLTGSFSLLLVSAAMAVKDVDGWGWFLIAGFVSLCRFSYKSEKKKNNNTNSNNNE